MRAVLLLLVAGATGREDVAVRYSAPPECPSAEAFVSLLPAGGVVTDLETRYALRVALAVTGTTTVGRLVFADGPKEYPEKLVRGADCAEVAAALALAAGLALEAVPVRVVTPAVTTSTARAPAEPTSAWQLRARAVAFFGRLAAADVGAGVDLAWRRELTVGFGGLFGASDVALAGGGRLGLAFLGGRAFVCPLSVELGPVDLDPCAGLELGVLRGKGQDLARTEDALAPWVAPSLELRARLPIGGPVELAVSAGLAVPLIRPRFLRGNEIVHEVAPVTGAGAVELGVSFW